jgi:hypothetical protein
MAIKFEDLDVININFEEKILPNKSTVILPRLNGKEIPKIKLPTILLGNYGVPKLGQFFKTDKDRSFIQIPVYGGLMERFELLDYVMGKNDTKQALFGGTDCHEYSQIVRQGTKGPFVKLKLELDYDSGEIETIVWHSQKLEDGTIEPASKLAFDNIDEFALAFPRGSLVVCVIKLVKVWVVGKKYGLTLKLSKANVLPPKDENDASCDDCNF